MARRIAIVVGVVALLLGLAATAAPAAAVAGAQTSGDEQTVEVHLFWLRTCPHCAAARQALGTLAAEEPRVQLVEHEVSSDAAEQQLFVEMTAALGGDARAVPAIIVGDRLWVGYDDTRGAEIRAEVDRLLRADEEATPAADRANDSQNRVDVPLVGEVDVGSSSLLTATLVIALVDGVNPCSLWVLSILLALVLHSGSRRRVLLVGSVFLVVTTALYGLYVVGAYSLLSYVSYLSWIQRVVAAVVGALAVVNLRDYFRSGPATLSIPEGARPGIYRRARRLVAPDGSWLSVIAGTTVLAAGVSLIETPCSAALPLMWTNLVSANDPGVAAAASLFTIYMAIFLIDELVLFGIIVVTMRAARLQERHGRTLRLVTGSIMLALAAAMLVDPNLLGELDGVLAVLAATVTLAVVLAAIGRRIGVRPAV